MRPQYGVKTSSFISSVNTLTTQEPRVLTNITLTFLQNP